MAVACCFVLANAWADHNYEQGFIIESEGAGGQYLKYRFYETGVVADDYRFLSNGRIAALSSSDTFPSKITVFAIDGDSVEEVWSAVGSGKSVAVHDSQGDRFFFYSAEGVRGLDTDGKGMWTYTPDVAFIEYLLPCPDGAFLVGSVRDESRSQENWNWRAVKLDRNGTPVGEALGDKTSAIYTAVISADGANVFFLVGKDDTYNIVRVSSDGTNRDFETVTSSIRWERCGGLAASSDGGAYLVMGYTGPNSEGTDVASDSLLLTRFNPNGAVAWQTLPFFRDDSESPDRQFRAAILETDGGDVYVIHGSKYEWLIGTARLDAEGLPICTYDSIGRDDLTFNVVREMPNDWLLVAGQMYPDGEELSGFEVVVTDRCRAELSRIYFKIHEATAITDVRVHGDGSYEILGPAKSQKRKVPSEPGCGCG